MKARVQKWGNSLALRIPKSLAAEIGLRRESDVELSLEDGSIVVAPVAKHGPTLAELLACVTADNLHREVATGPAAGNESW